MTNQEDSMYKCNCTKVDTSIKKNSITKKDLNKSGTNDNSTPKNRQQVVRQNLSMIIII